VKRPGRFFESHLSDGKPVPPTKPTVAVYEPPVMEEFRAMELFNYQPPQWSQIDRRWRALMIGYRRQKLRNEAYISEQIRLRNE
jgi:hypothetical protein